MAWRRPGDKPLSEQMMVSLLTHICVTRPQWIKPNRPRTKWPTFRTAFHGINDLWISSESALLNCLPWHSQGFLGWFYFWLFAANSVLKSTRIFHNDISHLCNEISWQYRVWQVLELMQMHQKERLRRVILTASWFIAIDVGRFFPENCPRFPWHILIFWDPADL